MDNESKHKAPSEGDDSETTHSILTKAFGDKYHVWNDISSDVIALTPEETKKLTELIEERDHYEIKVTIENLKNKR
ncbi:MAG: hypothetical protein HY840_00815 [Bacteroidetes bacterium]|nr:hypothetical protein [Bacteroidota bacterium]